MKALRKPNAKRSISYFLILLTLFYTQGCHYFKVKSVTDGQISNINDIGNIYKYFVVHSGSDVFALKNISIDSLNISGYLQLTNENVFYFEGHRYRYRQEEQSIINEVHIYLSDNKERLELGYTHIPFTAIKEVRIIEKDKGKTQASYVFGTLGIVFGFFILLSIIIILTKSSCPYIYAYDGDTFIFEGEIFGGAINQNLERDDYMPLPSLKAENNTYHLRISNELKEHQFTNLAELIVVDHPKDQKVLLDKYGKPQFIGKPETPMAVTSLNGEDLCSTLEKTDNDVYLFNDTNTSKNVILLTFKKKENATKGKLILHAKNTLWFDYLFGEFLKKFGTYYDQWMEKQRKMPTADRIQQIRDNDFPLSIYLKQNGEWELVDYLYTVGPLASRDFVVPVDLTSIAGQDVEIKVETGFMFWELDYASMDFSPDMELPVTILNPAQALDTRSKDWTAELQQKDDQYLIQLSAGDMTELVYNTKPSLDNYIQSVFLHTSGYYELIREFDGLPKITELYKFKQPGYFAEYSRARYMGFLGVDEQTASVISLK